MQLCGEAVKVDRDACMPASLRADLWEAKVREWRRAGRFRGWEWSRRSGGRLGIGFERGSVAVLVRLQENFSTKLLPHCIVAEYESTTTTGEEPLTTEAYLCGWLANVASTKTKSPGETSPVVWQSWALKCRLYRAWESCRCCLACRTSVFSWFWTCCAESYVLFKIVFVVYVVFTKCLSVLSVIATTWSLQIIFFLV